MSNCLIIVIITDNTVLQVLVHFNNINNNSSGALKVVKFHIMVEISSMN